MNTSPKMLIVVGIFCVSVIVGIAWTKMHRNQSAVAFHPLKQSSAIDTASADTNNEVLQTILARQKSLESENKKLSKLNEKLQKTRHKSAQISIQKAIKAMEAKLHRTQTELRDALSMLSNSRHVHNRSVNNTHNGGDAQNTQMIAHAKSFESDDNPSKLVQSLDTNMKPHQATNQIEPIYTIPANATLNNVALMTSIIAEVPVSGALKAPAFPFKAIVGGEQLYTANGFSLPEGISGMVIEGYSVGNMTLKCATAYVIRVLFVFNDGHFTVFPKKSNVFASEVYPKNALGYLSDRYGSTCMPGEYFSNVDHIIRNLSILGGVASAGDAFAKAQTSTSKTMFENSTEITGGIGKFLLGHAAGGASKSALEWYKKRVGDSFDVVVIPASFKNKDTGKQEVTHAVLNITQTIPIDLYKNGRKISYENKNKTNKNNNDLD